mmetsp:Transcript_31171/g.88374  ORF Transcript_31171/g.88374 Transcript_31171/m.88374 type:complete len:125 (-) Transcript_31171:2058-2432(-)
MAPHLPSELAEGPPGCAAPALSGSHVQGIDNKLLLSQMGRQYVGSAVASSACRPPGATALGIGDLTGHLLPQVGRQALQDVVHSLAAPPPAASAFAVGFGPVELPNPNDEHCSDEQRLCPCTHV